MEQGDFFNTIDAKGVELQVYRDNAGKQERTVLDLFMKYRRLGPSELHRIYPDKWVPITSLRRAVTSLAKRGFLVKTDVMVTGKYGMKEHLWEIAE